VSGGRWPFPGTRAWDPTAAWTAAPAPTVTSQHATGVVMAYIARDEHEPGSAWAAVVDRRGNEAVVADYLGKWIRMGAVIERVDTLTASLMLMRFVHLNRHESTRDGDSAHVAQWDALARSDAAAADRAINLNRAATPDNTTQGGAA